MRVAVGRRSPGIPGATAHQQRSRVRSAPFQSSPSYVSKHEVEQDSRYIRGAGPMTTIYDPPVGVDRGQTPPTLPWPGPGGPGGPGGPSGYGGGDDGPGRHVRRFRRLLLVAGAAIVVCLGAFVGLQAAGITPGRTLTTAQITARTSPGLVDVVSTLGYQQAEAAGTGLVLTPSGEVLTNNHVIAGAT